MLATGDRFDDVLRAAQVGAPWAFERLYIQLAPQVARYVRMRGVSDPDDITSEVFLAVFERLADFDGSVAKFRSWLFTIAHRKAVDAHRRLARRPWVEVADAEAPDLPGGNVEDEALEAIATGRVLALLAGLSEVQRDVLLLRIVADLSVEQVAGALGKSAGAVKQHQRRALSRLRELVEQAGVTL